MLAAAVYMPCLHDKEGVKVELDVEESLPTHCSFWEILELLDNGAVSLATAVTGLILSKMSIPST